jgi:hypothetical protein
MCLEDVSIALARYKERLKTFKKWSGVQTPESLAKAGFYYTNKRDIVICYYCGIEIENWLSTDEALSEHLKWSPNCLFATMLELMKENADQSCSIAVNISPKLHTNYFLLLGVVSVILYNLFNVVQR